MDATKPERPLQRKVAERLKEAWRFQSSDEPFALALGAGLALLLLFTLLSWAGHANWGYAAAYGCLSATGLHPGWKPYLRGIWPVAIAIPAGALLAAQGMGGALVLAVIAGMLGLVGSRSRPWAIGCARATVFLVMSAALFDNGHAHPCFFFLLVALGSVVTSVLGALLCKLLGHALPAAEPAAPVRTLPWRRLWRSASAWRFAARLGIALALSLAIAAAIPTRHLSWIAVTCVLLTNRPTSARQGRALPRALGTVLGVLAAACLPTSGPNVVMIGLALLAGARVWLQPRHYLLYSAVMALFVMMIINRGQVPAAQLLEDRVIATLAGIAITALLERLLAETPAATRRSAR